MHHFKGGAVVARSSIIATLIVLFLTYLIGTSLPGEAPTPTDSSVEAPASSVDRPGAQGNDASGSADARTDDVHTTMRPTRTPLAGKTIVIDAGHGGTDPGARGVSGTTRESYNTLFVAKDVQALLEKAGAHVIMTRSTDVFVPLDTRVAIANRSGADVFVSIHNDSNPDPSVRGVSTYYYTAHSRRLADVMQASLANNLGARYVGVFQRSFAVVRGTYMPSVLLELGFLTNWTDEQLLADPAYRYRSAEAIYNGILQYFHGA